MDEDLSYLLRPAVRNLTEAQAELDRLLAERETLYGPDLHTINTQIRRVRLQIARNKGTHTRAEWAALVAEFDRRCVCCWTQAPEGQTPNKAYVVPIYMGGSDAIDNLQPLCPSCSSAKRNHTTNFVAIRRQNAKNVG